MNVFKCLAFAFILFTTSCLSEKKAAGIKSAAIQDYVKHNPCANDTLIFNAGSDTAIVYDTVYFGIGDATPSENYFEGNVLQGDSSFTYKPTIITKQQIKYINKTQTIHDTIKAVTVDRRMIGILEDSIGYKNNIIRDLQIANVNAEAKATKFKTWFWLENILLIILIAAAVWFHFKYGFLKGAHI